MSLRRPFQFSRCQRTEYARQRASMSHTGVRRARKLTRPESTTTTRASQCIPFGSDPETNRSRNCVWNGFGVGLRSSLWRRIRHPNPPARCGVPPILVAWPCCKVDIQPNEPVIMKSWAGLAIAASGLIGPALR